MFIESPGRAIKNYQSVGVESGVASADPHKLIVMLFEGARQALDCGRLYMQQHRIAAKGEMISKAIMIIDHGLKASLDKTAGGELATRLDQLYDYMTTRLLTANLQNDPAIIEEVSQLLGELQEAWASIEKQPVGKIDTKVAVNTMIEQTVETGATI
ncbi:MULTISPECIES: flagellar export chaperone FliS [Nitrosomonas]|uniref:Flagellar protein FliS n=2 Tax=Nitrosomonas eutropha TaxID=916 RepID=A0ABX5M8R3_9PROT|nr:MULTISPECIES: flagellar export chaperone FliS [Nitrosomonas]ABI59209.1 flagellar protein FliS [Nitrosomonas eutropha C91]MXS79263.1 flagellar export chaperone FliS [Nitrosomonas sp. GH22]PXV83427.1 flagellar protein FliS [Nitrosomonas eutropha]SCX18380.1 flagellar protein FliS [Nitrosomonas eutropha]SDW63750.1 flagellar protein FliS [Nitrosomonas eutropha]